MALINFNKTPYYDDYDETKNTLKVLFKPGFHIQVRELNELQSIFLNQIKKFGDNIFKNGSIVEGGQCSIADCAYIVLNYDSTIISNIIDTVTNISDGSLKAKVLYHEVQNNQLFIFYSPINLNGNRIDFRPSQTIYFDFNGLEQFDNLFELPNSQIITIDYAKLFFISEGIFYFNGLFIKNDSQYYVLFDKNWSGWIGFNVVDEIITSFEDESLLDNAIETTNFGAPGADRYLITLVLSERKNLNDGDVTFIPIMQLENGDAIKITHLPSYADFGDLLAKRTFEQNGNYALKPYKIKLFEHKKQNINDINGFDMNGDINNYVIQISPNISYVGGYRIETIAPTIIIKSKLNDTSIKPNLSTKLEKQPYFFAIATNNSVMLDLFSSAINVKKIYFYDGTLFNNDVSGTKIGEALIKNIQYYDKTSTNSNIILKLYVDNIVVYDGFSIESTKSMKTNDGFIASIYGSSFGIFNSNYSGTRLLQLINDLPIKTLKTNNQNEFQSGVAGTYKHVFDGTTEIDGSGTVTIRTNETFDSNFEPICFVYSDNKFIIVNPLSMTISDKTISVVLPSNYTNVPFKIYASVQTDDIPLKTKTLMQGTKTFTSFSFQNNILDDYDIINVFNAQLINKTNSNDVIDLINHIKLDNGQRDYCYTNGSISIKENNFTKIIDFSKYNLKVDYTFWKHNGSNGIFTPDSYPVEHYNAIGNYVSTKNEIFDLKTCIDYRPVIINETIQTDAIILENDASFTYSIETYLPRIDTVYQNKDGEILLKSGISSSNPIPPKLEITDMAICDLLIPGITNSINDIKINLRNIKRYSMKDIQNIETRISNIEYYTSLTLLEQSTANLSVKDANGFDRFKNGFVVDDFSNFQAADLNSPEFKAALDRKSKELRPSYTARNKKIVFLEKESSNFKLENNIISIDYDEVPILEQKISSRTISITPYYAKNMIGNLEITPNIDTWADTTTVPALNTTIDTGVDAFVNATKLLGTDWGQWQTVNVTTRVIGTTNNSNTNTTTNNNSTNNNLVSGMFVGALVRR